MGQTWEPTSGMSHRSSISQSESPQNLGSLIFETPENANARQNSFEVLKIERILKSPEPENLWTKHFSLKILSSVTLHLSRGALIKHFCCLSTLDRHYVM